MADGSKPPLKDAVTVIVNKGDIPVASGSQGIL